jgi:DNA-binding NarL/FixJ family response regulator
LGAEAIDAVARTLQQPSRPGPLAKLTRAEVQIALLVRRGMSNNEIAGELVISRRTVESHLSRIFRKLGIRTRTQLATISLDREA